MGGKGPHRQCAICGIRERHKGKRNLLFASFPREETRCKEWIRLVGDEDLVNIPLMKLRQLRHVCGDHFERRDLNKKGNRAKQRAIPKLNLTAAPLTDDQMIGCLPSLQTKSNPPEQHPTGPSRPKTSDEAPQTITTSDKPVGSSRPITLVEARQPTTKSGKSNVSPVKKNSQTHLYFIKDKKSSGVIQYFSKEENKYDLTEQSFLDSNTTQKIDNDAEESCAIDNGDETMHMKGNYVDDLKFNKLNLKLTQVLDGDDNLASLKHDYLSTTLDERKVEYKNASQLTDESGVNTPVTDNSDLETLKEISKSGEIVPKIKKVDDDVWVVGGDDHKDAVMDMEAVTPLDPEHFRDDGDEEHNVPQEHKGFRCNVCLGMIVGFRYRCCECEDHDMCSDCESRGEHPLHYVLRVPGYRKQCEVRRVLAAVHLALALPTDVKDELTIKIEDPGEEPPPDPLHTEEAAPTDPEPMGNENTPLTSTDLAPPPAKVPRIEPSKRNKELLKLVRTNKSDIPVALDALKRKAVVRLHKLKSPLQVNPAQIRSLHEVTPRKHTTDTYSTSVTEKKSIEKALENTRDSSQSRLQNIDHNIPTTIISKHQQKQHSSTQNVQSKSNLKTIDLLQFAGESQEVMVLPQNITMNSEKIVVVEQYDDDDVIVETNAEQVFYMTQEEFNALISAGTLNDNIVVQESPSDETLVLHPPTKSKAICDK